MDKKNEPIRPWRNTSISIVIINKTTGLSYYFLPSLLTITSLVLLLVFPYSLPTRVTIQISWYTQNEIQYYFVSEISQLTWTNYRNSSNLRYYEYNTSISSILTIIDNPLQSSISNNLSLLKYSSSELLIHQENSLRSILALMKLLLNLVYSSLLSNYQSQ